MYRYEYAPAGGGYCEGENTDQGQEDPAGRRIRAYSSQEWDARDIQKFFPEEERQDWKHSKKRELARNREEQHRRSVLIQRKEKRRRKAWGFFLSAAILFAASFAYAVIKQREAGQIPVNRLWIWRSSDERESSGAGQEADLLILVNKDHAIPADYQPHLYWLENKRCAVAEEMYGALKEMLSDGSDEGLQFVVASGYRDSEYQKRLLEEDIAASMEKEGLTWQQAYDRETQETMPPGHSEHETGLAADIVSLDYQVLDSGQEDTPECRWLQKNCSKYGFILRYPRGKEDITKVDYEPWHFRYVGKEAAREIAKKGITLEEYLGKD